MTIQDLGLLQAELTWQCWSRSRRASRPWRWWTLKRRVRSCNRRRPSAREPRSFARESEPFRTAVAGGRGRVCRLLCRPYNLYFDWLFNQIIKWLMFSTIVFNEQTRLDNLKSNKTLSCHLKLCGRIMDLFLYCTK